MGTDDSFHLRQITPVCSYFYILSDLNPPPLTLVELVLGVSAGTDGQHHLPQQRQRPCHLLLTHPVLHQAEVGVVGGQQPQQGRMETWVQSLS